MKWLSHCDLLALPRKGAKPLQGNSNQHNSLQAVLDDDEGPQNLEAGDQLSKKGRCASSACSSEEKGEELIKRSSEKEDHSKFAVELDEFDGKNEQEMDQVKPIDSDTDSFQQPLVEETVEEQDEVTEETENASGLVRRHRHLNVGLVKLRSALRAQNCSGVRIG